jgi:hypothetical protein
MGKEGEGGWSAIDNWLGGHTWPPLNSHFHSSPHLAPLMLTPLTKTSKVKQIPFIFFHSFIYFFDFFRFYDMQ